MTHILKRMLFPISFLRVKILFVFVCFVVAVLPLVCLAADRKKGYPAYPSKEKTAEEHWPDYEGCQDMDDAFTLKEPPPPEAKTEARACGFHCQRFLNPVWPLKESAYSVTEKRFKEELKKRVIFQIEAKMAEIRLRKYCVAPDKNKKKLIEYYGYKNWPDVKKACREITDKLKSSIKELWPSMAAHLALSSSSSSPSLSSPSIPSLSPEDNRVLSNPLVLLDPSPSHKVSGFVKMPRLTHQELKRAKEIYIDNLVEAYRKRRKTPYSFSQYGQLVSDSEESKDFFYRLTPDELKNRLEEEKPLHTGRKRLSLDDTYYLKGMLSDLRDSSRKRYFEVVRKMPELGYLESGTPNEEQLTAALTAMEDDLKEFLDDKIKAKEDMSLLLSFKSLVEALLKETQTEEDNSPYCLVAERARLKSERVKESLDNLLIGAMVVALVPCFLGGGISISICFGAEVAFGAFDVQMANTAVKDSLNRALIGERFSDISELDEKQKELKMAQWMLPVLLLDAGAVVKAGKIFRKRYPHLFKKQ